MLIPVTLTSGSSSGAAKLPSGLAKISNDEIMLIELQGSLEVDASHPSERDGKYVGKLTMDEATNKPTLLIGNHLLEGKIAALPKPFALLVRKEHKPPSQNSQPVGGGDEDRDRDQADGADPDAMVVDGDGAPESHPSDPTDAPSPGWSIAGIVKKKIIFSKRPMPVVGKR